MTALASVTCLPPAIATRVPLGRCALVSRSFLARMKSRASMAAEVRFPVWEDVGAASRSPGVAGLGAVGVGHCVAHLLEGVAPVAEVLGAVGHQLELAGT